jgi:hypothetical protein
MIEEEWKLGLVSQNQRKTYVNAPVLALLMFTSSDAKPSKPYYERLYNAHCYAVYEVYD